jgi:hypothetical protein
LRVLSLAYKSAAGEAEGRSPQPRNLQRDYEISASQVLCQFIVNHAVPHEKAGIVIGVFDAAGKPAHRLPLAQQTPGVWHLKAWMAVPSDSRIQFQVLDGSRSSSARLQFSTHARLLQLMPLILPAPVYTFVSGWPSRRADSLLPVTLYAHTCRWHVNNVLSTLSAHLCCLLTSHMLPAGGTCSGCTRPCCVGGWWSPYHQCPSPPSL